MNGYMRPKNELEMFPVFLLIRAHTTKVKIKRNYFLKKQDITTHEYFLKKEALFKIKFPCTPFSANYSYWQSYRYYQ